MIFNYWPKWFRERYAWPRSYCCVDTETTGYSLEKDVVTEWGHVLVVDGEITDRNTVVIDWTNHDVIPDHWLRSRLAQVKTGMELNGKTCHMTYERMQKEGMKPPEAFAFITQFTEELRKNGVPFVLHNGTFDENMLSANYIGFKYGKGFTFGPDGFWDTDVLAKASQLVENSRVHPIPADTLRKYNHRVKYTRVPGVKSNMDEYCLTTYELAKLGVLREKMHQAEYDAWCCHLLMQRMSKDVSDEILQPKTFVAPSHSAERKGKLPVNQSTPVSGPRRIRGVRNS